MPGESSHDGLGSQGARDALHSPLAGYECHSGIAQGGFRPCRSSLVEAPGAGLRSSMPDEYELAPSRAARRLARGVAVIIALMGAVALAGWTFGVPILATLVPGDVSMKANTALAFILAALALWQVTRDAEASRMPPAIGQAAAILVILIGGGALAEHVLGVDLGIDHMLVRSARVDDFGPEPSPRMAPGAALGLVLSGTALLVQLRLPAFATAVTHSCRRCCFSRPRPSSATSTGCAH